MGGCGSTESLQQADLDRQKDRREAAPPIGLQVYREGAAQAVQVRPWEPVAPSLERELGLELDIVTEVWLGQLRLEKDASWESQGVVDGAGVTAVVEIPPLLVVADTNNRRVQVRRLDDGGLVRTISNFRAGLVAAYCVRPHDVAVDSLSRMVVVADTDSHCVHVLQLDDGSHVRTIGAKGTGPGQFQKPYGVAVDGQGNLVVADTGNHRVQVLRLEDGSHVRTIGSEDASHLQTIWSETPRQFDDPRGVAVDGQGNLVVADTGNDRVQVLRLEDGSHVRTFSNYGSGDGEFKAPVDVAVDGQGNLVLVDAGQHRVLVLRLEDGSDARTIGSFGSQPGQFKHPEGVAVDGRGNLVVADTGNSRLQVLCMEDGKHVRTMDMGQFYNPYGVTVL